LGIRAQWICGKESASRTMLWMGDSRDATVGQIDIDADSESVAKKSRRRPKLDS
jgi:hypothetical protein